MSFTRKNYDKSCYDQYLNSVKGAEQYMLEVPANCSSNGCFNNNPQVIHGSLGNSTNIRDMNAESSLRNLDYKLDSDKRPANRQNGVCQTQIIGGNEKQTPSCDFDVGNTRMDNPAMDLRSIGINRMEWPLTITPLHEHRDGFNVSSRLLVKDNYKSVPENPLDPSPILPEGGNIMPCDKTTPVCSPYR